MWWTIFINRSQLDFVIIDTYSTLAFHFAWTSARICEFFSIPYVPIIHGGSFEKRIDRSRDLVVKFIRNSHAVVTPSEFLHRVIHTKLGFKCTVIPNAIDLSIFTDKSKVSHRAVPKIFWLRAYQELYNPQLAIDIISILLKKYAMEAELIMVGPDKDGSFSKVSKLVDDLGLSKQVNLYKQLHQAEWIKLAADCTVFLNTTTVDNTPVSLIEAMALGLPIVSTDVGGIPDLIQDGKEGHLYPSGDSTKAADLIFQLHQDKKEWTKTSGLAKDKALRMDWEHAVKLQWKKLLEDDD